MNKAILMGRLTKDPEIRTTQSGISVSSFTIAVDRKYKNADGSRETDFIPCVAWRQTGEFIHKYFYKGNRIIVEGEIQPSSWTDNDGQKRYKTEVIVDQAYFCENLNSREEQGGRKSYIQEEETQLPFDMS